MYDACQKYYYMPINFSYIIMFSETKIHYQSNNSFSRFQKVKKFLHYYNIIIR